MKVCPVCKATLFDDMSTCYGCMYRFGSNPALEKDAAFLSGGALGADDPAPQDLADAAHAGLGDDPATREEIAPHDRAGAGDPLAPKIAVADVNEGQDDCAYDCACQDDRQVSCRLAVHLEARDGTGSARQWSFKIALPLWPELES